MSWKGGREGGGREGIEGGGRKRERRGLKGGGNEEAGIKIMCYGMHITVASIQSV